MLWWGVTGRQGSGRVLLWALELGAAAAGTCYGSLHLKGLYSNKEIKFQYIPGWIELNFQDISDVEYQKKVAIN